MGINNNGREETYCGDVNDVKLTYGDDCITW